MTLTLHTKDGLQVLVHRLVAVDGRVHYLSMGGGREEVEAVWGTLAGWDPVYLKGMGEPLRRAWDELRYRSARIGTVYHGLAVSKAVLNGEILLWQKEEEAAKGLAQALGVPVLPAWVPFLVETARADGSQENLLAVGIQALSLDGKRDEMRKALQEALRKRLLPLPEEVKEPVSSTPYSQRRFP